MSRSRKNDPRIEQLLTALRAGNTRRAAARYAGIHSTQFYRWLEGDAAFRTQVERAEAEAEVRMLTRVAQAANGGDWKAAAWWLERRLPADYGRRERIELQSELLSEIEKLAGERGLDREMVLAELRQIVPEAEL